MMLVLAFGITLSTIESSIFAKLRLGFIPSLIIRYKYKKRDEDYGCTPAKGNYTTALKRLTFGHSNIKLCFLNRFCPVK